MCDLSYAHQCLTAHPPRFQDTPQQPPDQIAIFEINLVIIADLPYPFTHLQTLDQTELLQPRTDHGPHLNRHNYVIIIRFSHKTEENFIRMP